MEYQECFDLARTSKNFYTKVYGVKIAFRNYESKKLWLFVQLLMISC